MDRYGLTGALDPEEPVAAPPSRHRGVRLRPAELGHPVEDVTPDHGLSRLRVAVPRFQAPSEHCLVSEEPVLNARLPFDLHDGSGSRADASGGPKPIGAPTSLYGATWHGEPEVSCMYSIAQAER